MKEKGAFGVRPRIPREVIQPKSAMFPDQASDGERWLATQFLAIGFSGSAGEIDTMQDVSFCVHLISNTRLMIFDRQSFVNQERSAAC